MTMRRLSAQDSAFIYGESQRIPLHVGSLGFIDGAPLRDARGCLDIERIRKTIEQRLHLVPVFRQKLAEVPLDGGRPMWIDDPAFRIENHVQAAAIPRPGGRRELMELFSRLQATVLDRTRPLWEFFFVDGLEGDEVAVIAKVHHAMVDGSTGVELGKLIFDLTPEGGAVDAPAWRPTQEPGSLELAARAALDHGRDFTRRVGKLAGTLLDPAQPAGSLWKFAQAMRGVATGFDPLPFNAAVGSRRAFETLELPLEGVLQARRAFGVTVNDVALAAITAALRGWCEHRGIDPDEPRIIKALCPVDNRAEDDREFGSKVSAMLVDLPLDAASASERVQRVAERSRELKLNELAEGANMWDRFNSLLPATLLRATSVLQFRGLMAQGNLLVSNVRGPGFPFYAFGGRVRAFFPYFGVQDGLGLNVVVFSYDGKLLLGIASDPDLVPDREVFVECLKKAFGELGSAL